MKYMKKTILFIFIIGLNIVFCGALFKKINVEIDTEKSQVYKAYSIGAVLNNGAADNYDLCCVSGVITEISKNNKKVYIADSATGDVIMLDTGKVTDDVSRLNVGGSIRVYGTTEKEIIGKDIHIKATHIIKDANAISGSNVYCLENGKTINKSDMIQCTLDGGHIKYYVPKYWKSENVEINIQNNDLGYIDGYQYVLNKTPGSNENEPESFFVCYFKYDGNLLKDTSRSNAKPIEKAIAENIENGEIAKFPTRSVKTYYGSKYNYYLGQYNDSVQVNDDYYTEYIFEQDGEDGIVMYLYVYKKATHLDDIMFVTRLLEIK